MKTFRNLIYAVFTASLVLLPGCGRDWKDPSLSAEDRAALLLREMTLEEKVGQLICPLGWPMFEYDPAEGDEAPEISSKYEEFIDSLHGGMLWAAFRADPWTRKTLENGLAPEQMRLIYNKFQRYAVEGTRLGIPVLLAEEIPHGHMAVGATVYPTGIGMASTWDDALAEEIGGAVSQEARSVGAFVGFGPVLDLSREPRWSRVEESFGEDTYLSSRMGSAVVRGHGDGIATTLKHFIAYGIPEGGHNGSQAFVGERDLLENFLPQFEDCVKAGAKMVMTAYNSIDGIPNTASEHLIEDVLRGETGFDGVVISDLQSIDGLVGHGIASDLQEAAETALKAGVDIDLGARCYPLLIRSVREGRIDEKLVDRACLRVLKLKFELGLFENPYIPETVPAGEPVRSEEHVALARKAAAEGVILLENNGILPLQPGRRIAVVGPDADNVYNQLGDYTAPQERAAIKTVLDGIVHYNGPGRTSYAKGCSIKGDDAGGIPAAVQAARQADVVVAVVGGSSARDFRTEYKSTGEASTSRLVSDMECGEGFDRASLELLGRQQELLEQLKATGKPLIVIYIEGRPLAKNWASENADALLTAWYPGQEGGLGIADVLFGEVSPAGRLPVSVPRSAGQLPVYYNRRKPAPNAYVESEATPLYPFGYGLSYTTFEYSDLQISPDGKRVSVSVRNSGERDGDEVVQLYVSDLKASSSRPEKQLRAFRRVHIPAGESVLVNLEPGGDAYSLVGPDMKRTVEKGTFRISVGASSQDIRLTGELEL